MENNNDSNHSNIDSGSLGNMGNMLQLAQLFSQTMNTPKKNNLIVQPEFDSAINSQEMNILKAAIPYLDYGMQKQMAIIIKIMELQRTFDLYKDQDSFLEVASLNKVDRNKSEMLNSIKNYCSDKNKNMIDIIQNLMNLNKLLKNFQSFSQNALPKPEEEGDKRTDINPTLKDRSDPNRTQNRESNSNPTNTPNEPPNNQQNDMSNLMNMFNMFKSMSGGMQNSSNTNTQPNYSENPTNTPPPNTTTGYTNPNAGNSMDMMNMLNMFMNMNKNQERKDEQNA